MVYRQRIGKIISLLRGGRGGLDPVEEISQLIKQQWDIEDSRPGVEIINVFCTTHLPFHILRRPTDKGLEFRNIYVRKTGGSRDGWREGTDNNLDVPCIDIREIQLKAVLKWPKGSRRNRC